MGKRENKKNPIPNNSKNLLSLDSLDKVKLKRNAKELKNLLERCVMNNKISYKTH